MAELDVEWMFGDAASGILGINALASLNPIRWSGSLDFKKALEQMEELQSQDEGHRPIVLKIPSGITSAEHSCKNVAEAIDFIKKKSPEHIKAELEALDAEKKKERLLEEVTEKTKELEEAETRLQDEEKTAKEAKAQLHAKLAELGKQKEALQCQWMYGDAGSGWGKVGLGDIGNKFAHFNPVRWSHKSSMATTQEALEAVAEDDKARDRPIVLKTYEGEEAKEEKYDNVGKAVEFLKTITCNLNPALKPLEDANAEAENRLADAKEHVEKAKKSLENSQANAKEAGALE